RRSLMGATCDIIADSAARGAAVRGFLLEIIVPSSLPNVAIVGATGAVGQEFLRVLAQRSFPIGQLKLLASARSAGKTVDFKGTTYTIEELTEDSFTDVDLALFSAGGSI